MFGDAGCRRGIVRSLTPCPEFGGMEFALAWFMEANAISLVTTALRQRPLCKYCIAATAFTNEADADAALASIGSVVQLQRYETGRCYGCGEVGRVFRIDGEAR